MKNERNECWKHESGADRDRKREEKKKNEGVKSK
jgi:hypothetical protein